ncbi:TIGR02391 family protein [Curtobacterium sp. 1544]|uniref:TIGR02391 family protein n=1 Tax=Curtobacterium sp. 1544 TaxID=3156417 RepID=UPI00339334CD
MFTKTVVAPEDREIAVPVIEQEISLGKISDASSADAGMFLLNAFAWASKSDWTAQGVVNIARQMAVLPGGHSRKSLTVANTRVVEQYVADGIGWLLARGLVGPSMESVGGSSWMLTSDGLDAAKRGSVTHIEASLRLHADLHPLLNASARPNFERGDYATAVFAATHEVEVAVRDAAGFGADKYGVPLMRDAFKENGPLTDDGDGATEQQAISNLFAGAIGAFKNPTSHRTVEYESPIEAASIIHLADILLRIVDRAKARRAAEVSGE